MTCRAKSPWLLLALWLVPHVISPASAAGQDQVVVRSTTGRGTSRLSGEIVDLNTQRLILRRPAGREEILEAERIVEIETTRNEFHEQGNALFTAGKYAEALAAYRQAAQAETRAWVRRQILVRSIWCFQYQEQYEAAIDLFLSLHDSDPHSVTFDAMPLSWLTRPTAAGLQRRASELLSNSRSPAGGLIAASWLLPTAERSRALETLSALRNATDARIAFLAEAQLWRTQMATTQASDVERWQQRWAKMPEEIQAGPTFLLAQLLARLDRHDDAALTFLRLPILFPYHRDLAAQSLLEAARALEKVPDSSSAQQLYDEIVDRFPSAEGAAQARRALEQAP